jgi:hypothetical protein
MAKYDCVDSQHNEPGNTNPVSKMRRWLQVSPAGSHHWRGRPQSATQARRHGLSARVHHFFGDSDGTYGYRRIHADLVDEGAECSPEPVPHIMDDEGLITCQPRPFRIVPRETPTSRPISRFECWPAENSGLIFAQCLILITFHSGR